MHCRACQAPVTADQRFCTECGAPLPAGATAAGELDTEELTRLREEKERISGELHEMLAAARTRNLSSEERRDWANLYAQWRDLTFQITHLMDHLSPRQPDDRRRGPRRRAGEHRAATPERRSGADRRTGDDRRDPFWNRVP